MSQTRHWEIDALRTLAIVLMVAFHAAYDLHALYDWDVNVFGGTWFWIGRVSAVLFLLLVGASFAIAHERWKARGNPWKRHLRRAAVVLGAGLLVSAATWFADPQTYVRFGILQLIGTALLLLPFCVRLKEANALLGIGIIALWQVVRHLRVQTVFLLPLGIKWDGFRSMDFYPLIPWFGIILIGYAIGYFVYVRHTRQPQPMSAAAHALTWPGRHSLLVYMVHQPVVLAILWILL
jgi:uncharacterized membrane protein